MINAYVSCEYRFVDIRAFKIAADNHHKRITLAEPDRVALIALLKKRGAEELDYGEELSVESVTMIRRVTGAVGIYFGG